LIFKENQRENGNQKGKEHNKEKGRVVVRKTRIRGCRAGKGTTTTGAKLSAWEIRGGKRVQIVTFLQTGDTHTARRRARSRKGVSLKTGEGSTPFLSQENPDTNKSTGTRGGSRLVASKYQG